MADPTRTRPIGSIIGAVAGLLFVLLNAAAMPLPVVWRVAAVIAFTAIGWWLLRPGSAVPQPPPDRSALRTYGLSVTAMVVSIPVGATLLTNVFDRPDAVVVWVVFVVGVHFVPFARAFEMALFYWLALTLVLVAVVGGIVTVATGDSHAPGVSGVVAGIVLLAFSATGPRILRQWSPAPGTG